MKDRLRRRIQGDFEVDAWGLDPEVHDAMLWLGRLRWEVEVEGLSNVPASGPALLIVQRRFGLSELAVVATGIGTLTGRRVRAAGVPGVEFAEAAMRRTGVALAHPAEITSLLRDGHIVALGLRSTPLGGRPGAVDPALVEAAIALGAPVVPVAAHGNELAFRWIVEVGAPLDHDGETGHLAAVESVEQARDQIAAMTEARRR